MAGQRLKRIFVVDDEQLIAETLAMILERSGFSAQCFFNPLEALYAAQSVLAQSDTVAVSAKRFCHHSAS